MHYLCTSITNNHFTRFRMKKFQYLLMMLLTLVFTVSCSNDDDNEGKGSSTSFTVQLVAGDNSVTDFSNYTVKLTELKSSTPYTAKADKSGKAVFTDIPQGQYDIVAEDDVNGVSTMYGSKTNFTFSNEAKSVEVEVKSILSSLEKTFVLDELYFNQDLNNGIPLMYEDYFTIRNVSDKPLYADGLCIALCGQFNDTEEKEDGPMNSYLAKDSIVIGQLYQIPGDGHTYKVNPGESLVIAHSAINHKLGADGKVDATKTNSIDLSGANFEIYVSHPDAQTTDNPEVPNLKVLLSVHEAFFWPQGGANPIMLVRLDDATIKKMQDNKVRLLQPNSWSELYHDYMILPVSSIIDGVETADVDGFMQKSLPLRIDKSRISVTSMMGSYGQGDFVSRKVITDANGKQTVQDTNDSEKDFVVTQHGQKSYPKK